MGDVHFGSSPRSIPCMLADCVVDSGGPSSRTSCHVRIYLRESVMVVDEAL
jgi:hypothetical protein